MLVPWQGAGAEEGQRSRADVAMEASAAYPKAPEGPVQLPAAVRCRKRTKRGRELINRILEPVRAGGDVV